MVLAMGRLKISASLILYATQKFLSILATCHAERSEASVPVSCQTLRFAQGDMVPGWDDEEDLLSSCVTIRCAPRPGGIRIARRDASRRSA
jgi:hypothetical protein